MLSVANLERSGLSSCSFTVPTGTCTALSGPSGSGKSLLLRAIVDLDENNGQVAVGDTDRASVTGPDWRRTVGYLPAEPGWGSDTIVEHFSDVEAAVPLLETVGLKQEILHQSVETASTGERQRLALVRMLIQKPKALLLDEPTAALDDVTTASVENLIKNALNNGASILLVSHNAEQADRLCSQRLSIENGTVSTGTVT